LGVCVGCGGFLAGGGEETVVHSRKVCIGVYIASNLKRKEDQKQHQIHVPSSGQKNWGTKRTVTAQKGSFSVYPSGGARQRRKTMCFDFAKKERIKGSKAEVERGTGRRRRQANVGSLTRKKRGTRRGLPRD